MTAPRSTSSIPPCYFEKKYLEEIDPWHFRTSTYEREKYEATIAALSQPRYPNALEIGCAIGVLSARLASHCGRLLAVDASPTAIAEAARQDLPNVRFEEAVMPSEFPEGCFDLIVLSEVLYYFSERDLERLADKCVNALSDRGDILLCHWLGETEYPLTGHHASDLFYETVSKFRPARAMLHEGIYRLERLSFRDKREGASR
jgi:SAM-dependent methyltransferase